MLGLNGKARAAFYKDAKGNCHAYTWDRMTKAFTPVTPSGATTPRPRPSTTTAQWPAFSPRPTGNIISFIKHGGSWTRVAVPGSTTTEVFGLNDQGIAVGMYVGQHKQTYGFIFNGGGPTPQRPQRGR